MSKIKRSWDMLSDEQRQTYIQEIIDYFHNERNEEIGIIAAGNLLDIFLQTVGMELYNKGVKDSIDILEKRLEDIKIDIETLIKK